MRILSILICLILFSFADAQVININLTDVKVKDIIEQIESTTDYKFFYQNTKVNVERNVSVNFKSLTIQQALKILFKGTNVIFNINKNDVVLKITTQKKESINVRGKIIDINKNSLPGVNIIIKGTTTGVISDIEGNFSIKAKSDDQLEITYIGFTTKVESINGRTTLDITLEEEAIGIDEVVVVGYGTQKKVNITGAVETVSVELLETRPITDISKGLQGMVSGLNINITNGRASDVADINIRGFESINGGSPLILIDGVSASTQELADLNGADIKTISVLKDASSAAIYGARAAFGVILVQTKEGTGKLKIIINTTTSFNSPTYLPKIETDPYLVLSTKEKAAYPYYEDLYSDEFLEYAKKVSENPNKFPAVRVSPTNKNSWQYFGSTDWYKEMYKNYSISNIHNISISGLTDITNIKYLLSASYSKEEGLMKYGNDSYEKYNLRSKISFKPFKYLTVGNNLSINNNSYSESAHLSHYLMFHQVNRTSSTSIVYNPDGTYTEDGAYLLGGASDAGRDKSENFNFNNKLSAELSFFEEAWKVNADVTIKKEFSVNDTYNVPIEYRTGPNQAMQEKFPNSSASHSSSTYKYTSVNVYSKFKKIFSKNAVSLLVGFNQEEGKFQKDNLSKKDLISSKLPTVQLATGESDVGESQSEWAVRGLFGRFNYNYNEKYLLEINTRYDGTSRFKKRDRFGVFPSFSVGWRLDKEPFIPKTKLFTYFKIRFSWGQLGNQSVGNYSSMATMSSGTIRQLFNDKQPLAIYAPNLISNNLTWETVETKNFGIDLAFFNNKLSFTIDIFERYTKDMLTKAKTLPSVLGAQEPKENAADLKNRGWEFSLKWNQSFKLLESMLKYSFSFNLSDSRTWITKYDNPDNYIGDYYKGELLGNIWGLTSKGLYQSAQEILNSAYAENLASDEVKYFGVGDVQWKDLDGDGKITKGTWRDGNSGDYRVIGNSHSRYRYGMNFNVNWKKFDFSIFAQGVGKKDWYPGSGNHYFWSVLAQPWASVHTHLINDMWTPENTSAYFPKLKAYAAEDSGHELGIPQTRYLIDASYFRVKNITLGYSLPKSLLEDLKITKIRFYFSAENILTISDLTKFNLDPEVLSGSGNYPISKTYSIGLNLQF